MPSPRLKYEEPEGWSRETVEQALRENKPDALLLAVVAVSMHEEDQKYAQDLCVRLSSHPHFNVRGNAILGFGHIARVHRHLDEEVVRPIIEAALRDADSYVQGHAEDTRSDIETFLKWTF